VVEIIWTKLVAPHAVIEPVSETRVRNGIFCCRDRAANWPHSARLQEQGPRQPESLADMPLRLQRYCECFILHTTSECGWWARQGSPSRNENNALHKGEGKINALKRNGYFERCPHLASARNSRVLRNCMDTSGIYRYRVFSSA
jgi:hypothetical protein